MKGHLRVVDSATGIAIPARLPEREADGQMRLDLADPLRRRIVVAAVDRLHGSRLHELIVDLHPTVVMDLRHTIRFDLPGTNRGCFLEHLSNARSLYLRVPLEWPHLDVKPVNRTIAIPTRLYHETVERPEGNLMLLVAKPDHARYISTALNLAIREKATAQA
jgi:hypothetical protein